MHIHVHTLKDIHISTHTTDTQIVSAKCVHRHTLTQKKHVCPHRAPFHTQDICKFHVNEGLMGDIARHTDARMDRHYDTQKVGPGEETGNGNGQ